MATPPLLPVAPPIPVLTVSTATSLKEIKQKTRTFFFSHTRALNVIVNNYIYFQKGRQHVIPDEGCVLRADEHKQTHSHQLL